MKTPLLQGYTMPAEYEPHHGTLLIYPHRPGSWPNNAAEALPVFAAMADAIGEGEQVYMLTEPGTAAEAAKQMPSHVKLIELATDDAWARDTGPTFVKNKSGDIMGISWKFNAWGGEVDGLYAHWEKDDAVAEAFCRVLGVPCRSAAPFVLEGGSIHSDGEGTLLVTESCLLSAGRNPELNRLQIEEKLREYLGIEKVLWLPRGIYNDETNEHVDNVCAFVGPAEVVLAWTDDKADPQYPLSKACMDYLACAVDAKGRPITVHKLPIPRKPQLITARDLEGYVFEEGEDTREEGERLAASYVNFYVANNAVLVPQFGDENDAYALELLGRLFASRRVVPIPGRPLLVGGGNIHCLTQQIPKGAKLP